MGNVSFTPQAAYKNKQPVQINGFSFSKEHVPKELYRYGNKGIALQTTKLMQSRPNAPPVYVTRVYFPQTKHYETFLSKDIIKA